MTEPTPEEREGLARLIRSAFPLTLERPNGDAEDREASERAADAILATGYRLHPEVLYDFTGAYMSDPKCFMALDHDGQALMCRDIAENLGWPDPDPARLQRPGEGANRAEVERIVYHAMSSVSMSNITLESLKAAPPSVEGNYTLLYLSNAVDEIMALSSSASAPQWRAPTSQDQDGRFVLACWDEFDTPAVVQKNGSHWQDDYGHKYDPPYRVQDLPAPPPSEGVKL